MISIALGVRDDETRLTLAAIRSRRTASARHPAQTAAVTAGEIDRTLRQRSRTFRRCHVNNLQAVQRHAKMIHLAQEAVVRSSAQRHGDFFAGQFASAVFVDFQIRADNAVVVL